MSDVRETAQEKYRRYKELDGMGLISSQELVSKDMKKELFIVLLRDLFKRSVITETQYGDFLGFIGSLK